MVIQDLWYLFTISNNYSRIVTNLEIPCNSRPRSPQCSCIRILLPKGSYRFQSFGMGCRNKGSNFSKLKSGDNQSDRANLCVSYVTYVFIHGLHPVVLFQFCRNRIYNRFSKRSNRFVILRYSFTTLKRCVARNAD